MINLRLYYSWWRRMVGGVRRAVAKFLMPLTLLLGAAAVVVVIWRAGQTPATSGQRVGFQDADAPLMMPDKGGVDERCDFLSAWQRAQIPQAARFDPPLGTEHGGFTYNAQKFWEMNAGRGGHHLGDDLNGIGGMNTDLGDPVFAPADGLVVYAAEPSPGWGNCVILAHRTPDGKVLQSMFAHLDRIEVLPGTLVGRGSRIGTVGTAHELYPAHLHFEIRASDAVEIGGGYALQQLNRVDPSATVAALRNAAPDDCATSVLARLLVPNDNPWSALETQDAKAAERLLEIIGKPKSR
jgi:murein DD-endopeptidase MepM/ murein hydrolase activator NlpD